MLTFSSPSRRSARDAFFLSVTLTACALPAAIDRLVVPNGFAPREMAARRFARLIAAVQVHAAPPIGQEASMPV